METLPSTPHFTPRLPDFSTAGASGVWSLIRISHVLQLSPANHANQAKPSL